MFSNNTVHIGNSERWNVICLKYGFSPEHNLYMIFYMKPVLSWNFFFLPWFFCPYCIYTYDLTTNLNRAYHAGKTNEFSNIYTPTTCILCGNKGWCIHPFMQHNRYSIGWKLTVFVCVATVLLSMYRNKFYYQCWWKFSYMWELPSRCIWRSGFDELKRFSSFGIRWE